MVNIIWGVDSAASVDTNLHKCVLRLGNPVFWGRYLSRVEGVSEGLTKSEISFIRSKGIKISPIYNDFRSATGSQNGRVAARNAIYHAKKLSIPTNVVLFANIEDQFEVDADWILAWKDTIYPSGYRPGLYANPTKGDFGKAYCEAVSRDKQVGVQTLLWSSWPRPGTSGRSAAPKYKPNLPKCSSNTWSWQYGRDAKACPVDTNLADSRLLNYLY